MANDHTYNSLTLGLEKLADLLLGKLPSPRPRSFLGANGRRAFFVYRKDYDLKEDPGPTEPRPAHVFSDVSSLSAWLKAQAKAGRIDPTKVDVLVSRATCTAMLDPWLPQGSSVSCSLDATPAWARWGEVLNKPMNADQLLLLVRETSHVFEPVMVRKNGQELPEPGANAVLAALSQIDIASAGEWKVSRGVTGAIDFKGQSEKTTVSCSVEPRWSLRMAIYAANREDLRHLDLHLTTSVRTVNGTKELIFSFSCPLLEDVLRDARTALAGRLQTELGEGWVVGQGEAKTAAVPVPVDDRVLS